MFRDLISAHIIGDVALHIFARQAKIAPVYVGRHRIGCVVTCDQPAGRSVRAVNKKRRIRHKPVI